MELGFREHHGQHTYRLAKREEKQWHCLSKLSNANSPLLLVRVRLQVRRTLFVGQDFTTRRVRKEVPLAGQIQPTFKEYEES